MTDPIRVTLSRTKGWKKPPNTVLVSRPSIWGNPFTVEKDHPWKNEAWAGLQYSFWIDRLEEFPGKPAPPTEEEIRAALRGKNLACWCKPGAPCHADVLLEIANG